MSVIFNFLRMHQILKAIDAKCDVDEEMEEVEVLQDYDQQYNPSHDVWSICTNESRLEGYVSPCALFR